MAYLRPEKPMIVIIPESLNRLLTLDDMAFAPWWTWVLGIVLGLTVPALLWFGLDWFM